MSSSAPIFASGNGFYARRRLYHKKLPFFWRSSGFFLSQTHQICKISAGETNFSSWVRKDDSLGDFGGWIVGKSEKEKKKNLDFGRFMFICVGSSAALLLAALFHFSVSRNGYKFHFDVRFPIVMEPFISSETKKTPKDQKILNSEDIKAKALTRDKAFPSTTDSQKPAPRKQKKIVHVEADSNQKQALSVLTKLKIIEDDITPGELCTRGEYARWLVRTNSLLERKPKHKIVLPDLTDKSLIPAFDDISTDDHNFIFIQALAEAGIIRSKLLDTETCRFNPESFLTRLDLIDWRAQLEYLPSPEKDEKVIRKTTSFIDVDSVGIDAPLALLKDLSGDQSIFRFVFGNTRRLDPRKPVTKGQAAVALASGRVAAAVKTELFNQDAEEETRQAQREEIRRLMISEEDIVSPWTEKINRQRACNKRCQEVYQSKLTSIEEEKTTLESQRHRHLRERAALECQSQLLGRLEEDVDQLTQRLAKEEACLLTERDALATESKAVCSQADAVAEAKSVLEVEREAIKILRRWVEEEAVKNQMRARVLEAAAQRWRWSGEDPKING